MSHRHFNPFSWLVVLRINVDVAIFHPYLDLEALGKGGVFSISCKFVYFIGWSVIIVILIYIYGIFRSATTKLLMIIREYTPSIDILISCRIQKQVSLNLEAHLFLPEDYSVKIFLVAPKDYIHSRITN